MNRVQSHLIFSKITFPAYLFILLLLSAGCASQKKAARQQQARAQHELRRINAVDSHSKKIIITARSYTGTPYRWGGTTRAGMDCSGLLVIAFQAAGIAIPRTSHEQSKIGKNVSLYELVPGDLVFFAAKKGSPHKISHVGMVTEIRGKHDVQFIHASTKLGVVENNLFSDYYRRIYVKARRPF